MLVLKTSFGDALRELYNTIVEHTQQAETILVAHCLDLASRIHHEKFGTPLASVHFAPIALRSFYQSPQMFGMLMQSWIPRSVRRFQFWLADKLCDHLVAGKVNALRGELGLAPVSRILHAWYFSPQLVLGLFPEWFARPQPDWPPQTKLTGFPIWDPGREEFLEPDVEEFLQSGSPPVVFAPGSAMTEGQQFFVSAVEACQRVDRRGILLTRYPAQLPTPLPTNVLHAYFVPMSTLLPRCAALVQHGGIGTSSQGLAAGLPQVVMPMAYDQLDNATRLVRLGVAEILRPKSFSGKNLALALSRLLDNSQVMQDCHHWAGQFDTPRDLGRSCAALEALAPGAKL